MHRCLALLALLSATAFAAVPTELSHQGRLFDDSGLALDGAHDVTVRLYDAETGGTMVYESAQTGILFDAGYYSLSLDGVTDTIANGDKLWLALEIDSSGTDIDQRVAVVSVPYALRSTAADVATNVSGGGVVDADEIRINGTTVIDSSGNLAAGSGDGNLLLELGCVNSGEVAMFDGVDWQCAPGVGAHTHDASEVDSGVMDILRLPIGTDSSSVAAGDHLHAISQLTGVAAITQLPVGSGTNDVAAGDHLHDIGTLSGSLDFSDLNGSAAVGQLPTGTTASDVALGNHAHTVDFADLAGNAAFGQLPTGTGASDVAIGNHGHDIADISGTIDADSVGGVTVSQLVTKTVATGTVAAGGTLDVTHNQGSFDVGVTVWKDNSGTWTVADLGAQNSSMPAAGLAGHWRFDEGSGTTVSDSSGNGNDATAGGGAGWAAGVTGSAIDFDGNNGFAQAPDSSSLDVSGAGLTMASWVYRESSTGGEHQFVNKESSYELALQGDVLHWAIETTAPAGWFWHSCNYTPPLDTWAHVAVSYDGTNVRCYANGVQTDVLAQTGTVVPSNQVLSIGRRPGGSYFQVGRLDELVVYNRGLSVAEVSSLMSTTAPDGVTVTQTDNNTVTVENNGSTDVDVRVVVHH